MAEEGNHEVSVAFDLVNREAVKDLSTRNKTLLPYKKVNGKKVERWNTENLISATMQGLLDGSSIPELAKLMRDNLGMKMKGSAERNARTAMTSCENKARCDSIDRMESEGLVLHKVWSASISARTRESHLAENGNEVPSHEKFPVTGCMYPGDPDGEPAEVYNCRCALKIKVVGWNDPVKKGKNSLTGADGNATIKAENNYGFKSIVGYHDSWDDAEKANPNYNKDKLYRINCQRCCPTYEMRRRGYDVQALPREPEDYHKGATGDMVAHKWRDIFDGAKWITPKSKRTKAQRDEIIETMKSYGHGARAEIYVAWKGGNSAHVFMAENVNGEIIFVDPQTGGNAYSHFDYIMPTKTEFARLDNLNPNESLIKGCMKQHD